MKVHDISLAIEPVMTVYKDRNEKKPEFQIKNNHERVDIYKTELKIFLHTGTHVDAPLHTIPDG